MGDPVLAFDRKKFSLSKSNIKWIDPVERFDKRMDSMKR